MFVKNAICKIRFTKTIIIILIEKFLTLTYYRNGNSSKFSWKELH